LYRDSFKILIGEGMVLLCLALAWRFLHVGGLLIVGSVWIFLMILTLRFFRDPDRRVPRGEGLIVSPADGRVVYVGESALLPFVEGRVKEIAIYLSPWDVHVNRIPISGKVICIDYHPGRFFPAFKRKASERNEYNVIGIEGKIGTIFLKQIAGVVARRIVCQVHLGDRVWQGERFGIITFGSRVELYLPFSVTLRVMEGDRVKAGESIIGVNTGDR